MTVYYVRSTDGSDGDSGLTWALAKASLEGALAVAVAGDRIWLSQNHAGSKASAMTLTSAGTAGNRIQIWCGNDAAEPPTAMATTATVTTTGNSNISFAGFAHVYGVSFRAGSGATGTANLQFNSSDPWAWYLDASELRIATANSSKLVCGSNASGSDDQRLELDNCKVNFNHANSGIQCYAPFNWCGGTACDTGTVPTTLFTTPVNGGAWAKVSCVDLSAFATARNLVDASQASFGDVTFNGCYLGSGVSVVTGASAGQGGVRVFLTNCDSAGTIYRYRKHIYQGDEYHETTIKRTGGASDGTTGYSRKITTSAGSSIGMPYETEPMLFWLSSTGSKTATVHIVNDGTTFTDAEVWGAVRYLGTSGNPLMLRANDRVTSYVGTPANQATSTETWTTTGLSSPVKQKLDVSFTTQHVGWAEFRVFVATTSKTLYYCPKVEVA